jgi:hypothetical protein
MYTDMENWSEMRRRVLVEAVSRRQILSEPGMHWRTLRKMTEMPLVGGLHRHYLRRAA